MLVPAGGAGAAPSGCCPCSLLPTPPPTPPTRPPPPTPPPQFLLLFVPGNNPYSHEHRAWSPVSYDARSLWMLWGWSVVSWALLILPSSWVLLDAVVAARAALWPHQ